MQNDSDTVLLDTSFISALYNTNDIFHKKAIEIFETKISDKEIIIPITVILEFSILSQKYLDYKNFQEFLSRLNYTTYYLDIFFETDLKEYLKTPNKRVIKAIDLSILISTIGSKSTLISFDKKLMKHIDLIHSKKTW